MPEHWVLGLLTSNIWSFAGDSNRSAVGQFSFQYFISHTFPNGWFITSSPTITANWKKPSDQQWTVPFSLGAGREFHWGSQSITLSMQAYYNVIRPSSIGPNWQLQLALELLFPPCL